MRLRIAHFCGNKFHPCRVCPARNVICYNCLKKGRFAKVWRSSKASTTYIAMGVASDSFQFTHAKVNISISINSIYANALVDAGSTLSQISDQLKHQLNLELDESNCSVSFAVKGCLSKSFGLCKANIEEKGREYNDVRFTVLIDLVSKVILGQDFMDLHKSVHIHLGSSKTAFHLGAPQPVNASTPVSLFKNLSGDCKPIATKPPRYSHAD